MILIGLTGPIGAGKSTAAEILVGNYGFQLVKFAGPLKRMLKTLGLTHEQIEGSQKEIACDLLQGKTPRFAMQTLGTEWGRDLIGKDFWIDAWKADVFRIQSYIETRKEPLTTKIVVDDARFPNEFAAISDMHYSEIWEIERPGFINTVKHESESYTTPCDKIFHNNKTVKDLKFAIDRNMKLLLPAE